MKTLTTDTGLADIQDKLAALSEVLASQDTKSELSTLARRVNSMDEKIDLIIAVLKHQHKRLVSQETRLNNIELKDEN